MTKIDKNIKIKKLKTGSENMILPRQEKGNEGAVGKHYENELRSRGFKLNSGNGIDIPDLRLENKTRNRASKAPHTTGTMTYDNILATPWAKTTFAEKLQHQNRMEYDNVFNVAVNESVFDFSKPEIQDLLERDYEKCREELRNQGAPSPGTIVGGQYGMLEHKGGKTYAHRISDAGMRKLKGMAKSVGSDLFTFE